MVEPRKEGTEAIPARKEDEHEIDVVGLTDDEKTSMEFREPSPPEEWYEIIQLMHGLPSDEINREQIDLTKEQQPTPTRDKVNKRNKEEVTANTSEQALCELNDLAMFTLLLTQCSNEKTEYWKGIEDAYINPSQTS